MKRSSLNEAGNVIRLRGPLRKFRLCTGQLIGDDDCPFMKRWVFIHDNGGGIRLHHFMPNHYEAVAHDHPFGFLTIVLRGGYTDISPCPSHKPRSAHPHGLGCGPTCDRMHCDTCHDNEWMEDNLSAGSVRYRPARHLHKTRTGPTGAWTLVFNGPKTRTWGFINRLGAWIPWMDFHEGRAACEDIPQTSKDRA